jgi:hypothetical protein
VVDPTPRHVRRGGTLLRVADPDWDDPLDTTYSQRNGGRWNPPGSFGALYLTVDRVGAHANVARLFVGLPYGPEDLDPDAAPRLVELDLPDEPYVDAVSNAGLTALGLPATYPFAADGSSVPHATCQPIGQRAFGEAELGIACRSAAPGARGKELVWFANVGRTTPSISSTHNFDDWFWA